LTAAAAIFKALLVKNPSCDHLETKSRCVHNPNFEGAIIKIQQADILGSKVSLSKHEAKAVSLFKLNREVDTEEEESEKEDFMLFIAEALALTPMLKRRKVINPTGYRSTLHVC